MYGLPRDIDLGFFKGKTLLQACFGAHDLILYFEGEVKLEGGINLEGEVSVTVTSLLGCQDSGGRIQKYDDFRIAVPAVLALLNQTVLTAEGDEEGTLTLKFDGNGILAIYDDSKEFESYTIKCGERLIVV
jgi:hypothetical protein